MPAKLTPAQRFRSKVEFTDTCWLWTGAKTSTGYGNFCLSWRYRQYVKPHRYAFKFVRGYLPDMPLDHLCRIILCVLPDHLEPVTQLENVRRGQGHGHETHCPGGHEYSGANLMLVRNSDGAFRARRCRACKAAQRPPTCAPVRP